MTGQVSDTSSHRKDQIANFAEILRNAPSRQRIFEAVYRGKKQSKSVQWISRVTPPFDCKRVTEIAKRLVHERLIEQGRERIDGSLQTVYRKIEFVASNKAKILQLARNKKKLDSYHTKTNPRSGGARTTVTIRLPFAHRTHFIAIDAVDQFSKAKKIKTIPENLSPERLPENCEAWHSTATWRGQKPKGLGWRNE